MRCAGAFPALSGIELEDQAVHDEEHDRQRAKQDDLLGEGHLTKPHGKSKRDKGQAAAENPQIGTGRFATPIQLLPEADPLYKVSIIPRGRALGGTQQILEAERYTLPEGYLRDRLAVILRHAGVLLQWHSLSGRRLHFLRGRAAALRERRLGAQRVVLRLTTLLALPS